jgi:ankyrin repeat protein
MDSFAEKGGASHFVFIQFSSYLIEVVMSSSDSLRLLSEVNELIEKEDKSGLEALLSREPNIEMVSLGFPAPTFNNKTLIPAIHEAIKTSAYQEMVFEPKGTLPSLLRPSFTDSQNLFIPAFIDSSNNYCHDFITENLDIIKMIVDYDESFLEEDEEDSSKCPSFKNACLAWSSNFAGLNPLHLASTLGYSRVALILLALGMNPRSQTPAQGPTELLHRAFTSIHLATYHGHLNILHTFLYFLKNSKTLKDYVAAGMKGEHNFEGLPSTYVSDLLAYKPPTYDYFGNLIESPSSTPFPSATDMKHPEQAVQALVGDTSLTSSTEAFNSLLNRRTGEGDTTLHMAAYHKKSLIVEFILGLAKTTNIAFIHQHLENLSSKNGAKTDDESDNDYSEDEAEETIESDKLSTVLSTASHCEQSSTSSNSTTSTSKSRNAVRLSQMDRKKRIIQVDGPPSSHEDEDDDFHHGKVYSAFGKASSAATSSLKLSPLMISASRGCSEQVASFASYNEALYLEGWNMEELKAVGCDSLMVDFGRKDERSGDAVLHLACQSQLQRVFNYNYELNMDHYATIYQTVMRMPLQVSLEEKNAEGDEALDLLLDPAADLFECLYHVSRLSALHGVESLQVAYPTFHNLLDSCHDGSHAVRTVYLSAILSQLKRGLQEEGFVVGDIEPHHLNDATFDLVQKLRNPTSNTQDSATNTLQASPSPSFSSIAGGSLTQSSETRAHWAKSSSRSDISSSATLSPTVFLPSLELIVSLGEKIYEVLKMQTDADDAREHSCKLLDTSKIPFTRKFRYVDRRVRSGANGNGSSEADEVEERNLPTGHPDLGHVKEGATCPLGFGKGKKTHTTPVSAGAASSSSTPGFAGQYHPSSASSAPLSGSASSTDSAPSGHPDISKYPPGAVCPMGFGKKRAVPSNVGSPVLTSPTPPISASASSTTVSAASNGTSSDKSVVEGDRKTNHPLTSGYRPGLSSYISFDSVVIIGAVGVLASLAFLRIFQSFSAPSSSSSSSAHHR